MADILRDGFLGYHASLMLDVVVCALVLVVPLLLYSLWLVRFRRQYQRHKVMQIVLGCVLSVAVIAFEIDMRLHGGWRQIVGKRDLPAEQWETVARILYVHLVFAISTPLLWFATLVLALRHFSSPPLPGRHSRWHRRLGWLSTLDITLTSVTGLMFYYAAFVM